MLPNGDVLAAEALSVPGGIRTPFDYAIDATMKRAKALGPSPNRITLLRDADGDGVAEVRETFLDGLNQPFGMALVDGSFYVGNTDGVVAFPYAEGATRITAPGRPVAPLQARRPLDPQHPAEPGRPAALRRRRLAHRTSATAAWRPRRAAPRSGRSTSPPARSASSPPACATRSASPGTPAGTLWTVVNERDGLGDETPPDYLTSVEDGGFYGWPWCYWGRTVDDRVPPNPAMVAKAIRPDYALGGHTASLGLCWLPAGTLPGFPDGMAIGQHGSWNRSKLSGYKVIFVPFENGRPAGPPRDILTGFLSPDEKDSYGRPVGVALGPDGVAAGRRRRRRRDLARHGRDLMDHFLYRDGVLHAEDVPLPEIAAAVGTPVYVYSSATLTRHYRVFQEALAGLDHLICYAMKANANLAVLRLMASLGAGMDVVSEGEYRRARAAGVPGERIVFSGVGKTRAEMALALRHGIRQFNVESEPELAALSEVATALGRTAPIALRVNPDVDARTHAKIATGKSENKFGIPIARARAVYAEAARLPGIEVVGVDVHIGSQLTELAPFEAAFAKVAELTEALRADGHAIRRLDLGGGLGIPYRRSNEAPPLPFDYGEVIRRTVGHLGCEIEIEPGRLIAGNAGVLLSRVIYRKRGRGPRLPDPRRRHERPDPPGDVRRLARHRPGRRAAGRRRPRARRRRRPGLRDRRHLRRRPAAAAARPRRPRRLPLGRRLRRGDGLGVQLPAAGPRGAGLTAIASPWCARARASTRCSPAIPSPTGWPTDRRAPAEAGRASITMPWCGAAGL